MNTVQPRTDSGTPTHETLMTAGLEMACASVDRYRDLDRSGRRELLAVWAEFCQNLRGLGVAAPLNPAPLEG